MELEEVMTKEDMQEQEVHMLEKLEEAWAHVQVLDEQPDSDLAALKKIREVLANIKGRLRSLIDHERFWRAEGQKRTARQVKVERVTVDAARKLRMDVQQRVGEVLDCVQDSEAVLEALLGGPRDYVVLEKEYERSQKVVEKMDAKLRGLVNGFGNRKVKEPSVLKEKGAVMKEYSAPALTLPQSLRSPREWTFLMAILKQECGKAAQVEEATAQWVERMLILLRPTTEGTVYRGRLDKLLLKFERWKKRGRGNAKLLVGIFK